LKIGLYCPNKPLGHPDPSGDQSIAQGLVQGLEQLGHSCREMSTFRARWFWKEKGGWGRALRGALQALQAGIRWRPDLWLTYHTYYKAPDVIGPWLSRLWGIPYVLFQPMYGTRRRRDPTTRLGFYLNRHALTQATLAVINNTNDRAALERILPPHRLAYVAPGIFPEMFRRDETARRAVRARFGLTDEDLVVLTVARFRPGVKWESVRFLFHALGLVAGQAPPWCLLVVGDGLMEAAVRQEAQARVPRPVFFIGRVARPDLYAYYSAADLFAFPGIGESLGMVYLEAQACGVPVVALREGGIAQVVADGRTGVLVPERAPERYAETVAMFLQNAALRRRMGSEAAQFVQRERNVRVQARILAALLASVRSRPNAYRAASGPCRRVS